MIKRLWYRDHSATGGGACARAGAEAGSPGRRLCSHGGSWSGEVTGPDCIFLY